jgi:hypothetical protein
MDPVTILFWFVAAPLAGLGLVCVVRGFARLGDAVEGVPGVELTRASARRWLGAGLASLVGAALVVLLAFMLSLTNFPRIYD